MICSVFGLVVISSATASSESGSAHYVLIQILALVIGIVLYAVFTVIDIDVFADRWIILYAASALLLLAIIPFGVEDNTGNKSWLRFFGIGIQPSEVIKVVFIVVLAKHISFLKQYRDLNHIVSVVQLAVHFGIPFLAIVGITGDLGSALIFFAIFLVMLFVSGLKLYWFAIGAAGIAALIPFAWGRLRNDQQMRLLAPYNPEKWDPQGYKWLYQATKSKLALASGRLRGTGLFHGIQTQNQAIPAQQTDFIFSVIGEELGMVGCYVVLGLLLAIILRCVYVGLHSHNSLGMLVCFGVAGTLLFQTVINVGMCTGMTPVIGLTLPFFSYGGSSLFSLFAACGLVSGIKYRPKPERYRREGLRFSFKGGLF